MTSSKRMLTQLLLIAVAFGLACFGLYRLVFLPISRELESVSQRADLLSRKVAQAPGRGEELARLRDEYAQAVQAVETLDSRVTVESGVPYFLRDLEDVAARSGVAIRDLSLGSVVKASPYSKLSISLEIAGSYQQVKHFVDALLALERAISVTNMRLSASGGLSQVGAVESLDAAFALTLYVAPKAGDAP